MKIKKFFQNLFKFVVRKIFTFIYGSIKFEENTNIKDLKTHIIKNDKIISFFKENYKVYEIQNGRIYNDNVENVAVLSNNKIINGPSYQQIKGELKTAKNNVCLDIGTPRIKKKI